MAPFLRPSTWTWVLLEGALWLSVLCSLLSSVCCSHGPPKWRFSTSEVVIPRKVPQRMGKSDMSGQITYSMRFRGQRHVVHMKLKKNMISQNFPVYTSNDQGAQQEDYPFVPQDCYFYSYLEGVPGSQATLDTCTGGLKGMIRVDDSTYEIKPLTSSSKFEHVISLLVVDERSRKSKKCRNDEIMAEAGDPLEETKLAGSPRAAPVYLWRIHVKNIAIMYTVTHALFIQVGHNQTTSLELVLIMNSIADSIYRPSGLIVFARAICIWNKQDNFNITEYSDSVIKLMEQFGYWKSTFYWDFPHATSALLSGTKYGNKDYAAFQNGLCNPNWGVLYTHVGKNHFFLAASLMSHAVGHIFNIGHDKPGCVCFRRSSCVMSEFPTLLDMMSNCSHHNLHEKIIGWDACLSQPRVAYKNFKYAVPRCGNKVVDDNEQCDCGTLKDCLSNHCCGTNCQLIGSSTCAEGLCCQSCRFAPTGKVCRHTNGICDLPEYCSGVSEHCPQNFYIMDGTPCSPLAVCMSGNCSDRQLQCQALFGYHVKDASPACYKELNTKGDRFGNCGVREVRGGSKPLACQEEDIFCGQIHCDGVKFVPGGGEHTTFHHIKVMDVKEEQCFGYDAHHGTELPEMGLVLDGANCGPGKFCKAQKCVIHTELNFHCNITQCNYKGVCNNKGNCHCVPGFQPPHCIQRGTGGSVNSGPPATFQEKLRAEIHVSINRLIIIIGTRILLILASVLFGALFRALMLETEKKKKKTQHPTINK
ncbi:a disintegrin and metalloprotease domain 4 [Rattus norvegicus]|uniref:A disintegrin and metalloprotease domain 4 n=2 Tax=Rattus norvegicus TaxID=10116 RepID=Q3B7V9_RAT|nr:a disintegrin and metalloprotease domain 4 precursor [Rattus norvegicus]AAI07438.1 A disintegrin and metalloprotease domain 4 [Rattus norvegicus]EDL81420.1 a disintegrin and metalloprotease domain 4 [Rattus norvegicus]|eukprot:NP_064701.1 a disintegrin and metalloprotease domain 4 precursor [Rattus norvegicus]